MTGLIGSIIFLTRIPIKTRRELSTAKSAPWFPIAGLLIGSCVAIVIVAIGRFLSGDVTAALAVTIGILMTGAFHEDGLADTVDALVGGWTVEDRLRILKDSRHGTYGVTALVTSIAIRILSLGAICDISLKTGAVATICAHLIARALAVFSMLIAPRSPHPGLGSDYLSQLNRFACWRGLTIGSIVAVALAGWSSLTALVIGVVCSLLIVIWATKKIGGISGDILGAIEQVGEIVVFVVFAAMVTTYPIWW